MGAGRIALAAVPVTLMVLTSIATTGAEDWLVGFGRTEPQRALFARAGVALPYVLAAITGIVFLFAAAGSANIRFAGWGAFGGGLASCALALIDGYHQAIGKDPFPPLLPHMMSVEPSALIGAVAALVSSGFGLRVAMIGNAAFASAKPKRVFGRRAIYGEANWMKLSHAKRLFPEAGGIVIGEGYRVDEDSVAAMPFRADKPETWGAAGRSQLLCFDGSFGSSHGLVFAGSGGFKTTSVTVPTALKWWSTIAKPPAGTFGCSTRRTPRRDSTHSTGSAGMAEPRRRILPRLLRGS